LKQVFVIVSKTSRKRNEEIMKKAGRFTLKKVLKALDEITARALFYGWFGIGFYMVFKLWGLIG